MLHVGRRRTIRCRGNLERASNDILAVITHDELRQLCDAALLITMLFSSSSCIANSIIAITATRE